MRAAGASLQRVRRPIRRRQHLPVATRPLTPAAPSVKPPIPEPESHLRPEVTPAVDAQARWPHLPPARWGWAGAALSILLHAGAAAAAVVLMLHSPDGTPAGAPEAVEVEIISADAFESMFAEEGAQPTEEAQPEPAEEPAEQAEPVEAAMPDIPLPPALPPLADIELLPMPDLPPIPDPMETLAREIPRQEPPPEKVAPPPEKPAETPKQKPEAKPTKVEAKPVKQKEPAEKRAPRKAPVKTTRSAAAGQGTSGKGANDASSLAAARGSVGQSGTGGAGALASYRSRVMAHLVRYKRYPDAARRQQMQGRAIVTFSLDANGQVTGVSLARSSGHELLDAETLAMVRRASPFPRIPPEAGQTRASFTAPIVYDMR